MRRHDIPEYHVWRTMKARCARPTADQFPNYGGRGIRVCERWRTSFANFYADMGARPSPDHEIERVNNDGPYEKANCIWATRLEQAKNTRTNKFVTYNGVTLHIREWERRLGFRVNLLWERLQYGWPLEKAMTEPARSKRYITHQGVTLTLTEWAHRVNLNPITLRGRLDKCGWPVEKALTTAPSPD